MRERRIRSGEIEMTIDGDRSYIMAGTGHRPDKLGNYSEATNHRLISLARWSLEKYQPTSVISGMALGWDQALAEAAVFMKIPFEAAVPFVGQESRWPAESVKRYQRLLYQARNVTVVCEGGYAAWRMQRRNEWMVDHCDAVLALWNGSDGGTANCVRYAEGKKPVVNVWGEWARREVERLRGEMRSNG